LSDSDTSRLKYIAHEREEVGGVELYMILRGG